MSRPSEMQAAQRDLWKACILGIRYDRSLVRVSVPDPSVARITGINKPLDSHQRVTSGENLQWPSVEGSEDRDIYIVRIPARLPHPCIPSWFE